MVPITREAWLLAAAQHLVRIIEDDTDFRVPLYCVSVGFPKAAGGGRGRRAIGQCFTNECAADGKFHIFISPEISDGVQVLATLLHELIHAAVGTKEAHKGAFIKCARACGLVKPWTATTPSDELTARLNAVLDKLGVYPHGALTPIERTKKGSRLRLWVCICNPPVKIRAAKDDLQTVCVPCGTMFVRQGQ